MYQKLFCGFCNQVQSISTFYQLQNIMNPPNPENYQRLLVTVQQMIQSKPINWKFVHRLQLLQEQFNLELDMHYLLSKLKDQPIDPQKQQFVIDIMYISFIILNTNLLLAQQNSQFFLEFLFYSNFLKQELQLLLIKIFIKISYTQYFPDFLLQQYFTTDEELFKNLFNQLLSMNDLMFNTQLKMLQTYFQYPEFFDQDKVLPKLIQNIIAQNDLDVYDLVSAFEIFTYKYTQLTEENRQRLNDLKNELNQQIIKIVPALGQKQYRSLLIIMRSNEYHNEELKQVVFQYFQDNKDILGQNSLIELLNLCNLKYYINEDLKYQILVQINLLKVKGINESKLINKLVLPSISVAEQEMMANLISLSGIQLDKEYINTHFTGSNSQKREKLEQLANKDNQILQMVKEVLKYIDCQFNLFLNVIRIIQTFGLSLPELLQPMSDELNIILAKQIVHPTDLLLILNYFDECNILFDEADSKGMQHFQNYLDQDFFSYQKIHYLQRQFAYKKNQNKMRDLLDKSYKSGWTLELCSRQALLYDYYNIPLPKAFIDKFQQVIEDYVLKKRSPFDQIVFYKYIVIANWTKNLKQEYKIYYNEGQIQGQRMKREKTKNLDQSSFLEQEIKNDILQFMPKTFKLLPNQYVNGTEIDFIISNQKGQQLYVQIHGQTHFYHASTKYNYQTLLESFYLEKLGNYRAIHYYQTETQWKHQKEQAVSKLLSCLM